VAPGNIIEDADTQGFRARDIFMRHPHAPSACAIRDLAHRNEDGR
jgi:hypothetical protein